jgi:hypothetical protein
LAASPEASNQRSNDRGRQRRTPADERDGVQQLRAQIRKHERQIAFPDTEEVTGSNPVRPTIFENLRQLASPTAESIAARVMTAVAPRAVRRRQFLEYGELSLRSTVLRLVSQVNGGRRDMFSGLRELSHPYRTALHDRLKALPDACPSKDRFVAVTAQAHGACGNTTGRA